MKLYIITLLNGSVTSISAESYNLTSLTVFFNIGTRAVAVFFTHALISIEEVQPS